MANNLPYIVSGTITDSDSNNPEGIKIVIRNDRTIETISVTTDSNGLYGGDLANFASGYNISDQVTVIARYGLEDGSSSFTTASDEAAHTVDITTSVILDSADISYCTITEVYNELDGKTTSDISSERVRDSILRAEAEIDNKTGTSFKINTETDEFYDLNNETAWMSPESRSGFGAPYDLRADSGFGGGRDTIKLKHRPILSVTSLSRNTASVTGTDSYEVLTEQSGSGGDFIVSKDYGTISFINKMPYFNKMRSFKISSTWGLDRTSTARDDVMKRELVRELCILLAARQILTSKGHSVNFDSQENISLESISITLNNAGFTTYLTYVNERINELFESLGNWNVDMGMV